MTCNFSIVLKLLEKLIKIEEKISAEIAKEEIPERKAEILKAVKDRNCKSISDWWFNPD